PNRVSPRPRDAFAPDPRAAQHAAPRVRDIVTPAPIEDAARSRRTVEARDRAYRRALAVSDVFATAVAFLAMGLIGPDHLRGAAQRRVPTERCLLIGDAHAYARLRAKLETASANATLVGRMNLQRTGRAGERTAHESELRELIAWADVHRVIIEPQSLPAAEM